MTSLSVTAYQVSCKLRISVKWRPHPCVFQLPFDIVMGRKCSLSSPQATTTRDFWNYWWVSKLHFIHNLCDFSQRKFLNTINLHQKLCISDIDTVLKWSFKSFQAALNRERKIPECRISCSRSVFLLHFRLMELT